MLQLILHSCKTEDSEDGYSQLGSGLDSPDVCMSQVKLMRLTSFLL